MPFSTRTAWDLEPNALARLQAAKRAAGAPLLDLTASNPTTCGFAYGVPAILDALADPAQLTYVPQPLGDLAARAAISAYYQERGATVDPAQIVLTASTSEAYGWCAKLLADPGDAIMTPQPSYPLLDYLAGLESVALVPYPLAYDGVWHIDFPALEARLTPAARAIVVVHPNNPTGSFLKRDEYARLARLCHEHDLAIICDEVFADYGYGLDPARQGTLAEAGDVLTLTMSGLSKVAGLPQLKCSWLVVSGPLTDRDTALARLEVIADTYLSVSTPVQLALPRLLAGSAGLRQQITERVQANRHALEAALADTPAQILPAEGGWYAIVRLPSFLGEEAVALMLLAEDDVLVQPGYFYDFPFAPALVISLLPIPAIFAEGIERLKAVIELLAAG